MATRRGTRSVLFFTDTSGFGGAERALLTLIEQLDRRRWRTTLTFHDRPGVGRLTAGAAALGVELWPVPAMPDGPRGAARAVVFARALAGRRPDVFHAHLPWQLAAKYPLGAAVAVRVPAVVATYQLLVDVSVTRPTLVQQRALARLAGAAIAVSGEIAGYVESRLGWPPHKVHLIHNAVPLRTRRDPDGELRGQLSVDGKAIVLTPARLDPLKGHVHLLEAARSLPDVRFVFAGEGGEHETLVRAADKFGVSSRVSFLGHREDISVLIASADVVVLPSLAEGMPLAVLEAMTAGKPIVATAVGDVPRAVIPAETGVLVEPGDAAALASAIRSILDNPELATRLGEAAKAHAEQHFDPAVMAARVAEVYESLLGCRPRLARG